MSAVMSALLYIVWIYLISTTFGVRYWHHSPRLIQQHSKRHHQKPDLHKHKNAPHYSAKKTHYTDYDKLLEEQEINELYDNAYEGYDNFEDEYYDEMAPTAAWITTQANILAGAAGHALFRVSPGVVPPYIQVRYPNRMTGIVPQWRGWEIFNWHKYEKQLDRGKMTAAQVRSVYDDNSLRKHTEMELLTDAAIQEHVAGWALAANFDDACLADLGSKTAKSDLDFTFIYWPEPAKVVPTMVRFYNAFYDMYGDWPLAVYDMNFYIAAGFSKHGCYATWPNNANVNRIKALFSPITNPDDYGGVPGPDPRPLYELGSKVGYHQAIYWKADMYMSFLFVERRLDLKTLDEKKGDAKIKALTRYSAVFYWVLEKIRTNAISFDMTAITTKSDAKDDAMIFLKTLLYAMNYWSDESYVTNSALQLIFKKDVERLPDLAKFLAVLDCTAFIKRYYKEAQKSEKETEIKKDLWWFNKVSKYMFRNGKLLQTTNDFVNHETAKKTSKFPETVYNFLKSGVGMKANFDEDKLGLTAFKVNYYALAEQWAGEWDNTDGRAAVGAGPPYLKKIRGDVPLDYIKGTNHDFPIWTIDYEQKYVAFWKYKEGNNKKYLTENGCSEDNPGTLVQQMLTHLAYDDTKRHASFIAGKYATMGRMFFRARKIWDYMKRSKRHYDKDIVMRMLNKMVTNVIQNNVNKEFKAKDKQDVIKSIFDDIMKDKGKIPSWVRAVIDTSDRAPALANPSQKVLSFSYQGAGPTVIQAALTKGEGALNPFKGKHKGKTVRAILTG